MVRQTENVAGGGDAPFHGQLPLRERHFSYAKKGKFCFWLDLKQAVKMAVFLKKGLKR